MAEIAHFTFSAKGNQNLNEDYIGTFSAENDSLYFVCDGHSTYGYGELGARTVAAEIMQYINDNYSQQEPVEIIENAVKTANEAIWNKREDIKSKFGAAIAGIYRKNNSIYAFWIGDVRIYQLRGNLTIFQSEDHSLSNFLKHSSQAVMQQAENYDNILTASITGRDIDKLTINKIPIIKGDSMIICSDGFWKNFPDNINTLAGLSDKKLKNKLTDYNEHFLDNYSVIKLSFR